MIITTVLLDADGVVQRNHTFATQMATLLDGRASFQDLFDVEHRTITGQGDLREELDRFLTARGMAASPDDLLSVWLGTRPVPGVLPLVDAVRARGVRVHLATNQNPVRGRHMVENLGYERHFDSQFYSFQIGLAKPDPAFFEHIVERLGVDPGRTLFVDDMAENVDSARRVGLVAEHVHRDAGAAGLAAIFADHDLID